jgi:hypothetical protein
LRSAGDEGIVGCAREQARSQNDDSTDRHSGDKSAVKNAFSIYYLVFKHVADMAHDTSSCIHDAIWCVHDVRKIVLHAWNSLHDAVFIVLDALNMVADTFCIVDSPRKSVHDAKNIKHEGFIMDDEQRSIVHSAAMMINGHVKSSG